MFFERDLKLLYRFFKNVAREKTLQLLEIREKNIIAASKTCSNVIH